MIPVLPEFRQSGSRKEHRFGFCEASISGKVNVVEHSRPRDALVAPIERWLWRQSRHQCSLTQMGRPFGRPIARTTSVRKKLRSGRSSAFSRRSSRIGRSSGRIGRSFSRSGFGRSSFFNSSRLFNGSRLAAGRDAEGENGSGSSRHAQFELRHRFYPSSQRRGLPPTRKRTQCQGLTVMASGAVEQGYAYLHSGESGHQASTAAASDSSSCAKLGCIVDGTEPRPISTETCAALPCKCATSTSRMIL